MVFQSAAKPICEGIVAPCSKFVTLLNFFSCPSASELKSRSFSQRGETVLRRLLAVVTLLCLSSYYLAQSVNNLVASGSMMEDRTQNIREIVVIHHSIFESGWPVYISDGEFIVLCNGGACVIMHSHGR